MNCILTRNTQYRKNNTLLNIRKGTPKLSTESAENVLGGKKGNINAKNRTIAAKILVT